jgi:lysophospholipase L1-like esterase
MSIRSFGRRPKDRAVKASLSVVLAIAAASPSAAAPGGIVPDPCAIKDGADFANLCRYRSDNFQLLRARERARIVFMGDSITEFWLKGDPSLFRAGVVDRGISGQTTPQMLLRFRQDVIDLRPRIVHIMAGTNDIAGNTGPTTLDAVEDNIRSMAELARAHGIRVIVGSVLPAARFTWAPDRQPAPQIAELNRRLKRYAAANRLTYADYYSAMANARGGMDPALAEDGVHPTPEGYRKMRPVTDRAIAATGR